MPPVTPSAIKDMALGSWLWALGAFLFLHALAPQHLALGDADLLVARLTRFSLCGFSMSPLDYFLKVFMILSANGHIAFTRARSASTIDRRRSTEVSSSSFTTTYS